ncbi:diaminopimelate decarboxylase family protein [Sodalis sp. RH14]|uniref:diaminopimelate decarboxylase family protein n=1 Tax=Sodalis sp. RH14 TaxID=3394329 RepID=UPI0039B3A117
MNKFPLNELQVNELERRFGTPLHIYFEGFIEEQISELNNAFSWCQSFKNYFAVKATPNPYILNYIYKNGMGMDCSSLTELILMEKIGIRGEDIIFTSNDTPDEEFIKAYELGATINLDDYSHISRLKELKIVPNIICCRYLPSEKKDEAFFNGIIGSPVQSKFGIPQNQIIDSYAALKDLGVKRFGIHTMQASNEKDENFFIETADEMFRLAKKISYTLDINIEFINLGGGLGIAQHPDEKKLDIIKIGSEIKKLYYSHFYDNSSILPEICMENGRFITGPAGFLVTKVRHNSVKHKKFIGVDSCMSDLMRPALYKAYHHISTFKDHDCNKYTYDVVGSLCENNDKFAIDRELPNLVRGDYLIIHDTGAHGLSMGFNYNGKLKSPEVIFSKNLEYYRLIRRREIPADLFSTLNLE